MAGRSYIAIDLKSFYASVECADRGLDPLGVNLVVADESRTEKTICLAVSPSLKQYGIAGRARLFEVIERVKEVNAERKKRAPGGKFVGESFVDRVVKSEPGMELSFITAVPRMRRYMEVSRKIYGIYLRYVAPEDIHVYSVDEVFMDVTAYLRTYGLTPHDLAVRMIREVLKETGITATAGIGTNLYLSKIAMDIEAKHVPADADGVRIAELSEETYRSHLWGHLPLTDFWRIGRGTARTLQRYGIFTMGDLAAFSLENEALLYKLFGVNAELLIDHAWGYESCTMADIHAYRPKDSSLSVGQVLSSAYGAEKGKLVMKEMTDALTLDLVARHLVTDQVVLTVCYDSENLRDPDRKAHYQGPVVLDHYGRATPKEAHGSRNLNGFTSSGSEILRAAEVLFEEIVNPFLLIRRMFVVFGHVLPEGSPGTKGKPEQLSLFSLPEAPGHEVQGTCPDFSGRKEETGPDGGKERRLQETVLSVRSRYGKNALLRGMNFLPGATQKERNEQVGGHKG